MAPTVRVGTASFIDAKVGDVNGKPIYASAVFDAGSLTQEAIGPRLAAEARRAPYRQWQEFAARQIGNWLSLFVTDELLRAEALANLSPEEKQGFGAFIERLQRDVQRQRGGSRAQASRSLEQSEGITLDQWRRRQEDVELVRLQLAERVVRRVNVSYRDIEQRYGQQSERFNRPPVAIFRLAQVFKDKPADVEAFREKLASGLTFAQAAESKLNYNKPEKGGREERELKGDYATTAFFANEQINAAAQKLQPGEVVGPIETSSSMAWLQLEAIQERAQSLYDAQLQIEDEIRRSRREREQDRYLGLLRGRTSMTDLNAMLERLLEIAQQRYYPSGGKNERTSPKIDLTPGDPDESEAGSDAFSPSSP
jgi:hypothetical protein